MEINIIKPYKDDVLFPLTVYDYDDQTRIDVYEEFYELALEYYKRFSADLFSDDALEFLSREIEIEGYLQNEESSDYYYLMTVDCVDMIPDTDLDVLDIEDVESVIDETEFEFDAIKENGMPAALIVCEGRIAAISSVNFEMDEAETEVELAVETLPEFRGMGYGKAVLSHMAKKLFEMGKKPTYRVSRYNIPSVKTANACGFEIVGKEFYFICYKENM